MFRSGFHLCAKEVLQYLADQEKGRDLTPSHMINHLHKVASEVLQSPPSMRAEEPAHNAPEKPVGQPPKSTEGHAKNCVPVIQRTYPHGNGEQSGSDTDTDSGYGGEHEKRDSKAQRPSYYGKEGELKYTLAERMAGAIKQEGDEPQAKRLRADSSEDESLSGHVVGGHASYMGFSPHQPQLCMPFYLLPHAAAATCWYAGGMPMMYQGMSGSAVSMSPEKLPQSLVMSPRAGSPVPHQTHMDSSALLQALKQVSPMNLETKE